MDEAVKANPRTSWWIKSDGVDVVSGLMESVKHEWNGDMDLADGEVQRLHATYLKQLELINGLCRRLTDVQEQLLTVQDLHSLKSSLPCDGVFIDKGMVCMYMYRLIVNYT